MGYSTLFFLQAGLPLAKAFDMSIAAFAVGLVGTIISWFLLPRFGRRTLYLAGLAVMTLMLFFIGFIGIPIHIVSFQASYCGRTIFSQLLTSHARAYRVSRRSPGS